MFFYVKEHISVRICVSLVGEHISLGICVSLMGEHITICFPAGGTLFTRDMCFLGRGTHITTECVSLLGKHIASRKVTKLRFSQSGYGPRFGPKMAIFQPLFLGNVGQENVFYDILERKTTF